MTSATDFLSTYENGLAHLLNQVGQDNIRYPELLTYQQRLSENIQLTRRLGDDDTRRTQWAAIVEQLNILALSTIEMSFNELCQEPSPPSPSSPTSQPKSMMYNTAVIRNLLRSSFDNDSLRIFCYDHFRPIHEQFTNYTSFLENIQYLIIYCEQQGQFDTLLSHIQTQNPYQHQQYISAIHKPHNTEPTIRRSTLEIELSGDLSQWSSERRQAIIGAIAGILNILPGQITINHIQAGNIYIQLDISTSAANRLITWFRNEELIIQELGITKVQPFIPSDERQLITGMTKQVLTQFAPQELPVSTRIIDPLIDMALLDQYASVRDSNVSGGLGGNKLFAFLIVPVLWLTSRRLLTTFAQTTTSLTQSKAPELSRVKAEVQVSVDFVLTSSDFPLNRRERRTLEKQVSNVLLDWLKNTPMQKDFGSISPNEAATHETSFNKEVQGPLHTGSGDINIHHSPNITEPTDSGLSSYATIIALIVIVAMIALAVILALTTLN